MVNSKYGLDKFFQDVLYRIEDWINEESGCITESINAEYVNIFVYSPLSGNAYIKLPCELKNSRKGLINIKINGNKWFLWCHIRHLNLLKTHQERIAKADNKMINDLDYKGIESLAPKKDFSKIEKKNNIFINVFCYENKLIYPVYVSDQKFKNCMDLLLISDEKNIMSISKILIDFCDIKQKVKIKNTFEDIVYNVLLIKKF